MTSHEFAVQLSTMILGMRTIFTPVTKVHEKKKSKIRVSHGHKWQSEDHHQDKFTSRCNSHGHVI